MIFTSVTKKTSKRPADYFKNQCSIPPVFHNLAIFILDSPFPVISSSQSFHAQVHQTLPFTSKSHVHLFFGCGLQ